ncbi:RNA polymerase II-associated protein 3 [Gouania willdenowi]|uniref:RNA polymerase II-associated protein 3-like n=1 Tax=Gouania willdenowi TaxID=441366 RepID=A0A8C5N659_GOUWI|nr:RNA polymerase II-associated protein 3-like [Gouania willdenowi]
MPRKKCSPKGGSVAVRMPQNSRLIHTHESMVDYLNGQAPMGSFLNVFAPNFFGFNFARPLEDNLIYSDEYDDDDDDDDYDDDWCSPFLDNRPRSPSIQIKELTDQEAEEIYKKQREEEQRKNRTERNKRKKMRKKEKKRSEKENREKDDDVPEEEESVLMPKPLETPLENPTIDSKAESNESNTNSHEFPIQTVPLSAAESSGNNDTLKAVDKKKKDVMEEQEFDLKLSGEASSGKSVPEKKSNKKLPKVKKREIDKPPEVQKNDQKNTKMLKKAEVHKEEETHTITKERSVDPPTEEFARRSIELAGLGNRLAALGQFEMAVTYFTDAIKFNPTEYKLFGNRSLCYERLEQYENALSDADVALFMQPTWIKGLFRKGKALFGLKRYYEASLVYKEVLKLESSSVEAAQELKRAHELHLMEMGFSWSQSSDALQTHASLEAALEALFIGENKPLPQGNSDEADQPAVQEVEDDDGEWTVLKSNRLRTQRDRKFGGPEETRSKAQSMPQPKSLAKTDVFPVWVGTLRPSMTYMKLRELFSRAGTVYSIKMLLDQECALVNFSRKEDCERAIQYLNGVVVDGAPLTVRHPYKVHTGIGNASKECFFWRTTGCTEPDCTYKHIPEHKNMDRERFTNRLGNAWNSK